MSAMSDEEQVDRILRRSLTPADAGTRSASCLDAETLAAWTEGRLQPREQVEAEAHAAGCDRCLATIAALARTEPPAVPAQSWRSLLTVRWLVPATAALAALVLWVAVDTRSGERAVDQLAQTAREAAPVSAPEPQPSPPPAPAPAPTSEQQEEKKERFGPQTPAPAADRREVPPRQRSTADAAGERRDAPQERAPTTDLRKVESLPTAPPPSAAPSPLTAVARVEEPRARRRNAVSGPTFEVLSPDPAVRWRVAGTLVEHSQDEGRTWQAQESGAREPLLAGAAPSPTVCWLVGRAGTVFVTTDGRTWRQTVPPASADLVGVSAEGPLTASVKTADGAGYRTSDGGTTWVLQETAAASF
jgi:hypothetical protein